MSRPIGVILVALLVLLSGLSALAVLVPGMGIEVSPVGMFVNIVFAGVMLYLAWGLFTLRSWAWLTTLILQGLNALYAIVELARDPRSWVGWVGLAVAAAVIAYLFQPRVRELFGRAKQPL